MAHAVPPAPRLTLLEWIDSDDGTQPGFAPPACRARDRELHATLLAIGERAGGSEEPLQPPPGLPLAPIG